MHCCCETGNLLSRPTEGKDMKIVDIMKEDDFTNANTVKGVIRQIRGPGDIFFYCSPCTGGSTWQRLNLELAKRKGWNNTIVKIIDHWDLHWRLWDSFEQVVKHRRRVGATVLLDWPRFCAYWQEKRVSQFLKEMKFKHTDFDGCMYGLVSRRGGADGLPVRKPWRIAFINSSIDISPFDL